MLEESNQSIVSAGNQPPKTENSLPRMQLRVSLQTCTSPTAKPSSFCSKRTSTVVHSAESAHARLLLRL